MGAGLGFGERSRRLGLGKSTSRVFPDVVLLAKHAKAGLGRRAAR